MFERLGAGVFRLRFLVVAAWVLVAIVALVGAPSLAKSGSTDQSTFLPAKTESVEEQRLLSKAFPSEEAAGTATLSFSRASGLTDEDRAYIADIATWMTGPDAPAVFGGVVKSVVTAANHPEQATSLRSADGQLEMASVNFSTASFDGGAGTAVKAMREHFASTAPDGLEVHVTGSLGIGYDYLTSILQGTDSTTLVTILLVVIILLLIYRAPLAALVPLITIGMAFLVSRGVLGVLAAAGWKISSLLDTFVVVIVFGVGTDYTIFLISRFREEVSRGDWHAASTATVKRIGAVISASAATVIVGLGSMAVADFGMIQTTGPALAITIFVTLVAGLTLAPALLGIFGHYLFWPLHERDESEVNPRSFFGRLAGGVSRHPGTVTVSLLVVLLLPVVALGGVQSNYDTITELPSGSDARLGFDQVAAHLGRGQIMPSTALVEVGPGTNLLDRATIVRLRDAGQALEKVQGVASVSTLAQAFEPSFQLGSIARGFTGGSGGAAALMKPAVRSGLAGASAYVDALAPVFPVVATTAAYTQAAKDLAAAPGLIDQVREAGRVWKQLRTIVESIPAAAASGSSASTAAATLVGYVQELVATYPEVTQQAAYHDLLSLGTALAQGGTFDAATVQKAAAALGELERYFETQKPDALLFPESLPTTAASSALETEIATSFERLPDELNALAQLYATQTEDLFIPADLATSNLTTVQQTVASFLSADGTVTRMYIILSDDPYSGPAFDTIRRIRASLATTVPSIGPDATAYVGGATAQMTDINTTLGNDFQRVAIITVLGILLVLIVLLRAALAPVYLVLTVLLTYFCTLGLTAWLYVHVFGHAGMNYYVPLIVFVLLVALGSDYNIFLMSRVREESETRPMHEGIRIASARTGAVITSAGLILAGTFAAMASSPLVVLFQVGVTVAVGVMIDTFVVRSILVPAITTLFDTRAWWPSGTGRRVPAPAAAAAQPAGVDPASPGDGPGTTPPTGVGPAGRGSPPPSAAAPSPQ